MPTRRRFLRGIGGISMALPFLEIFAPRNASAGEKLSRYAFMFGGFSIGSSENNRIAPATAGPWGPVLPPALQPLDDFGVSDVVSMVSDLTIPVGATAPEAA
ncbi:MAG: hypothetical protein AAF721_01530, partial [Myxococcota bacterium]